MATKVRATNEGLKKECTIATDRAIIAGKVYKLGDTILLTDADIQAHQSRGVGLTVTEKE